MTILLTPSPFSVATSVAASFWNSISLPARRTHSPVEVSAAPRIAEPHACLLQDLDEGARDLLPARIERLRRADVVQVIERLDLLRGRDDGHAESARPVAAGIGGQPPGIALRLVGVEHGLELVRELAFHQHAVLAHAEEPRQVLELDRARGLAVAAGRARPQRVLADDARDRAPAARRPTPSPATIGSRCVDQVLLQAVVAPISCARGLPVRKVGQASLQRPHSVQVNDVEAFLPGEVLRRTAPISHRRLVGILPHHLLEIDDGHACSRGRRGGRTAPAAR